MNKLTILFILVFLLLKQSVVRAQEDTAGQSIVKLHYFNINNSVQYLILESTLKKNKVFTPQKNKTYDLFIDSSSAATHLAKLITNEEGKAKAFIPPAVKAAWDGSSKHTFIVKDGDEEVINDYIISKSKITIDTATTDSVRSITASVMRSENNEWVPAKDIEMKIGIERLGGSILTAGDEETYTTDSSGTIVVEFKKNKLPGDTKGNFTLAARVDDNEELGNLLIEKTVPWGTPTKVNTSFFNQRTLWTTRFKTPYWLLIMAYSIVIGVWGTMIYLVRQIVKIKKLGV